MSKLDRMDIGLIKLDPMARSSTSATKSPLDKILTPYGLTWLDRNKKFLLFYPFPLLFLNLSNRMRIIIVTNDTAILTPVRRRLSVTAGYSFSGGPLASQPRPRQASQYFYSETRPVVSSGLQGGANRKGTGTIRGDARCGSGNDQEEKTESF